MKLSFVLLLLAVLAGCARPPQLSTALDVQKSSDNLIVVKLKVTNLDDRATVPIAIDVSGQARTDGHWGKSETLLHPAAFVLNRKEERIMTKLWRVPADAVRTTLVVREQENANLLKSEKAEKTFGAASAAPTSK